jgi:hypothetical protein
LAVPEGEDQVIVRPQRLVWMTNNELSGHSQMNEPDMAIIKPDRKVFPPATNLANNTIGQFRREVRS